MTYENKWYEIYIIIQAMQNKWTGVFDDVLKKITERRG